MPRFLYVFRPRSAPPGFPLTFQVYENERPSRQMLRDLPPVEFTCELPAEVEGKTLAEIERWYLDAVEYGGLPARS